MPYLDYANELMGFVPKLSYLLAQKAVNRAWREIRESRHWSFLIAEDIIIIPALLSAGSALVTQYSDQVVFSATAAAQFVALDNPVITKRQFRVGAGPVYSIIAYDPATLTATLDRKYTELTSAAATYQVYACYYDAPATDFMRWISVKDPITPRYLKLRRLREELDRADPQRTSQGEAYAIIPYKVDPTTNLSRFEVWPHPTAQGHLVTTWQRRGVDFVDQTDTLPPQIPEELLMLRARLKAYEWAVVNVGRVPELRGVSWSFAIQEAQVQYKDMLQKTKVNDEESFMQNWTIPEDPDAFLGPIDGKFLQAHDAWWM